MGPSELGGKDRMGRPGSREKEIGFEREREREREREKERAELPEPPTCALRIGQC